MNGTSLKGKSTFFPIRAVPCGWRNLGVFFLEYIQFSFMHMGNCVTGATPMFGNVGFRHMEAESHS